MEKKPTKNMFLNVFHTIFGTFVEHDVDEKKNNKNRATCMIKLCCVSHLERI